ncbi:MAG: hypothetical protein Q9212_002807 [Teloschistes hypoglaucus]
MRLSIRNREFATDISTEPTRLRGSTSNPQRGIIYRHTQIIVDRIDTFVDAPMDAEIAITFQAGGNETVEEPEAFSSGIHTLTPSTTTTHHRQLPGTLPSAPVQVGFRLTGNYPSVTTPIPFERCMKACITMKTFILAKMLKRQPPQHFAILERSDATKKFVDVLDKQVDEIKALMDTARTTKEDAFLTTLNGQKDKVLMWQKAFHELSAQVGRGRIFLQFSDGREVDFRAPSNQTVSSATRRTDEERRILF